MKKTKMFVLSLLFGLGAMLLSFSPIKAQDYSVDDMEYDDEFMISGYNYSDYSDRYRDSYRDRYRRPFRQVVTHPRTVYLIDASNSANQLNIINATRGGSTTAAWITVRPEVYDRVVDDYNELAIVSVRVNRLTRMVTFRTVDGTYSTYPVAISFQR